MSAVQSKKRQREEESPAAVAVEAAKPRAIKSATVDDANKHDDLEYDLGNLLAYDRHPVNTADVSAGSLDAVLKARARDNVQLLFNRIFALPVTRVSGSGPSAGAILAELPDPTLAIPREKPIPQPRPPTKWELYKQSKGFSQRAKSSRMVFDEQMGEWRPRYGFRRANSDKDEWIMDHNSKIPDGSDPFLERRNNKRQKVEKQRKQEYGNKKRAHQAGLKEHGLPGVMSITNEAHLDPIRKGTGPKGRVEKRDLSNALSFANRSTASIGKFDRKLKGQKRDHHQGKRSYDPVVGDKGAEKSRSMKVFDRIVNKQASVDMNRATNNQMRSEDSARRGGRGGGRGGRGGRGGGRGGRR